MKRKTSLETVEKERGLCFCCCGASATYATTTTNHRHTLYNHDMLYQKIESPCISIETESDCKKKKKTFFKKFFKTCRKATSVRCGAFKDTPRGWKSKMCKAFMYNYDRLNSLRLEDLNIQWHERDLCRSEYSCQN